MAQSKTEANPKSGGCGCGGLKKNQTSKQVFESKFTKKGLKGTGLFLIPAPQIGPLELQVVMVEDLEYRDCCKRGHECIAYKWIPHSIKAFADIKKTRDDSDCDCDCDESGFECDDNGCPDCLCGGPDRGCY